VSLVAQVGGLTGAQSSNAELLVIVGARVRGVGQCVGE
jgi:hypothetical protein